MALTFVTALRTAGADLINSYVNAGASFGKLQLAATADTTFATLLAEVILQDPAFTNTTGVLSLAGAPKTDSSANNTGTAGIFRIVDSNNLEVWRGTCTLSGGGGDLILNTLSVTAGQTFTITSASLTVWG